MQASASIIYSAREWTRVRVEVYMTVVFCGYREISLGAQRKNNSTYTVTVK